MSKTKACKKCKMFVTGDNCPACKGNLFSTNWQGRIFFIDVNRSRIANELEVKQKGEYAIKVR